MLMPWHGTTAKTEIAGATRIEVPAYEEELRMYIKSTRPMPLGIVVVAAAAVVEVVVEVVVEATGREWGGCPSCCPRR
jgi:hypothetical protein